MTAFVYRSRNGFGEKIFTIGVRDGEAVLTRRLYLKAWKTRTTANKKRAMAQRELDAGLIRA